MIPRPQIMGILNVTPDSFSDGGVHFAAADAIAAGGRMIDEGADILDVGGESTRPGASPVSLDEEFRRVMPVVEGLARLGATVSIDTQKAEIADAAIQAGAGIVNDVSALRSDGMAQVCAEAGVTVCLMHMQGTPAMMQAEPHYEDVVAEVKQFLMDRAEAVVAQGVKRENIWIDPGIGFGKTDEHNFALLENLPLLMASGYPVLIGVSRKGFLGRALGSPGHPVPAQDRLEGALAIQAFAQFAGVAVIRTHDVRASRRMADIIALLGTKSPL